MQRSRAAGRPQLFLPAGPRDIRALRQPRAARGVQQRSCKPLPALAVAGQTTPRYRFRLDALGCDHAHEMPVADDIRAPDWFVARFRIARAERKSV
jgi:hypothetical protein